MKKILSISLVLVLFTAVIVFGYLKYGTGSVSVYGNLYSSKYFNRDEIMEVNIEIDEEILSEMFENASDEQYQVATVTVNGDRFEAVNIRPKGNSSLSSVARSDSDRYSFKIEFDANVNNQTLAGLTQLNLNNNFQDPSNMREFISYTIFDEMGVCVPEFCYAKVYINGEYFGLYTAVESILEPYLENNFGNISGDLYKAISGRGDTLSHKGYTEEDYPGLQSQLGKADWSKLGTMTDALNNNTDDIEKYLDVDAALRYLATSTALLNMDSYQGNFAANYYLYEEDGYFTILPWDLNMSFGGFSGGGGSQAIYIDEPTLGAISDRPLIAKLFENEEYLERYHTYLGEVITKYINEEYITGITSKIYELIKDDVKNDPTAFYTYEQFEANITETVSGGNVSMGGGMGERRSETDINPNLGVEDNAISGNLSDWSVIELTHTNTVSSSEGEMPPDASQNSGERPEGENNPGRVRQGGNSSGSILPQIPNDGGNTNAVGMPPGTSINIPEGTGSNEFEGNMDTASLPEAGENNSNTPPSFNARGMSGGGVPGIMEITIKMNETIRAQLDGTESSKKPEGENSNFMGIGGRSMNRTSDTNTGEGNRGPNNINAGGMEDIISMLGESGGEITDEIKNKAAESNILDDELARLADLSQNAGGREGFNMQGTRGGMPGERSMQSPLKVSDFIIYFVCGAIMIVCIVLLIFFNRRRYYKSK